MCGIAGIIGPTARDETLLSSMAGELVHRGPDDGGLWTDAGVGVGLVNRRLAIIDLSPHGHQPMLSRNGRYVITFNGEIYNHRELRAEVEASGDAPEGGWGGHCDTETFLEAIAAWGLEGALERSVGMFAFALWDREQRILRLVRDRFGEKPLYYGWIGDDFLFASELKAIRRHPRFRGEVDGRALGIFVSRNYVPAPLSIYRGVFKLEPGCILAVDARATPRRQAPSVGESGDGVTLSRYWSYKEVLEAGLRDPIGTEADAIQALEQTLARAVESQSLADVPVGAFLSGGIDSSSVVALYQKYSSQKVRTFTIGFNEAAFNEADHAREVARFLGTEHHERVVTAAEAREVIPKLPQIYDEPFADSSQIPTFLVSGFAREQVKVALSGDAGDELFGGYNRYFLTGRAWRAMKYFPAALRSGLAIPLGLFPASFWDRIGTLLFADPAPYFGVKARKALRTIARARDLGGVFNGLVDEWAEAGSPVVGRTTAEIQDLDLSLGGGASDIARMMYCDAVTYLPDDILCKVDRASMAVSLEVHCPFLDHRVAELAARVPLGMKVRNGVGKHVLREMLYREAPRELFERPKSGFGVPVGEWIKGPLRDWAESLLDTRRIRSEGWFDAGMIERRWREHLAGRRDSSGALWAILMFLAWLDKESSQPSMAA
jgi:asparagine synthase (glutamine-hydrolysing)